MAMYLGDFTEDETVHFMWSTNDGDGASITRSTDGTVQVYADGSDTQSVAGITDTEDFDSLTGIHLCIIDLSADAFYAVSTNFTVVLAGATIDTQTVNAVLAHFSIENRFNEVDVTKWLGTAAAVPTTAGVPEVDITYWRGQAVPATTQAGVPEVDVTYVAGAIVNAATAQFGVNIVQISDDAPAAQNLEKWFDDTGFDASNSTIGTVTALSATAYTAIADKILTRDWNSVAGESSRSTLNALRTLRNKVAVSTTTITVYEEDDTTTAWSGDITTNASANLITEVDPT